MPTGEPWWNLLIQEFIPASRRQNHQPPRPISLLNSQPHEDHRARRNSEQMNRPGPNRQRLFSEGSHVQIREYPDSNNNSSNNFYNDNSNINNNNNPAHLLNMSRQFSRHHYYQNPQVEGPQTGNQRLERPRFNSYNRNGFNYRTTSSRRTAVGNRNDTTNSNNTRNRYHISRENTRRATSQEPRDNANLQIALTDRSVPSNDPQTPPVRDVVQNIEIETVNTIACSSETGAGNGRLSTVANNPESRVQSFQQDMCFLCEEIMQNSEQLGIHFCIGGDDVHIPISDPASGSTMAQSTKTTTHVQFMDVDQDSDSSGDGNQHKNSVSIMASSSSSTDSHVTPRICIGSKGSEKPANGVGKCSRLTLTRLHQVIQVRLEELRHSSHEVQQEKQKLVLVKKNLDEKTTDFQRKEELLKKVEEKLQLAQQDMTKKQQKDREELNRKWQELKDETKRMEEVHEAQKGRIRIDVGGRIFTTSIATLTCDQSSMLAAMFSGRHVVHKEEDGTVFIDRDGTHFRHILNYLRDGALSLDTIPRNRQILKELRNEAAFYQLNGLLQLIEAYL